MRYWILLAVTISLVLGNGCQSSMDNQAAAQWTITKNTFSDSVTEFKLNVFYEVGASPYVGNIGLTTNQTWDITKSSYQALFQNHPGRTVTVPSTLAQMTQIPDVGRSVWSSNTLISLAEQYVPAQVSGTQINMSVIFLNGTFEGNSNILGVHLRGHQFSFVFKDVVVTTGGDSVSQRYVEQATVVHELGHSIGLVDNGLPMAVNHEDSSHTHHTTNSNCVMYWTVDSRSSILASLSNFILANQLNLFGPESLADGRAYHP